MNRTLLTLLLALAAVGLQAKEPLRIAIFGDSYSTFQGYMSPAINECWYPHNPNNDVKAVEQTWWWQVVDRMGGTLVQNNSYSGSTIGFRGYRRDKENQNDGHSWRKEHADFSPRSFIARAVNLGDSIGAPELLLVLAGTNDSWTGAEMGDYQWGNWTRQDLFKTRPAIARLCHDLKMLYPDTRIVFILNTELTSAFNESLHTITKYYELECLDLHDIHKQSGHPSQQGMTAIADQVVAYLQSNTK